MDPPREPSPVPAPRGAVGRSVSVLILKTKH